ncbi:Arv1-like family-domain-containing protein [Schizophyllum fasciatum]
MPICTTCTSPVPFLYTVYESAFNLRLEECTACHAFADPYVEQDTLALVLDLILLKRGVFRHLLYNRGTEPRQETAKVEVDFSDKKGKARHGASTVFADEGREQDLREEDSKRWRFVLRLGLPLIAADACEEFYASLTDDAAHLEDPQQLTDDAQWTRETVRSLSRAFMGCAAETISFHTGITLACYISVRMLKAYDELRRRKPSNVRQEFRCSLVPLTLFYSSLTKLFLLFMLTIWKPSTTGLASDYEITLPEALRGNEGARQLFQVLDDDRIEREWVVRNVLGGMSAGFGLRVILDASPFITTTVILIGWVAKTAMARYASAWMGDERASEAWLAYSIP